MYPYDDDFEEDPEIPENGTSVDRPEENIGHPDTQPEDRRSEQPEDHGSEQPDTHRSYRDAEYTPQSEATVPPRYYIAEDKPPKEKKPRKKGQITFAKVAALCLVCALIGGIAGGALTGYYITSGNDQTATEVSPVLSAAEPTETPSSATTISSGAVTANSIYELGTKQVVGISSDITTTNIFGMTASGSVSGSGFIISDNGYILTNYHVIEDAQAAGSDISVILYDDTKYTAEIVGYDSDNDIAVLKIDADGLTPVTIGNSDSLSVGDTVYAIGNPLGELAYTMTSGIISATDRVITTDDSTSLNMFQFDAAVNSGNSGGPVYNTAGQVVGIVTAKYSDTGVEGLGFAIPINDAVTIANELITNGYVTGKAYMGVVVQTVSASVAQYYNMVQGAYVYSIESGSCADIAGLKVGDIITELDGTAITTSDELKAAVKQHSAGETVNMKVYRSGETLTLSLTFDEKQPDSGTTASDSQTQTTAPSGYPYGQGW